MYELSKGSDIISLAQKGFNCFLGPLGALFVLGMFVKKATPIAVIPAFILGELWECLLVIVPNCLTLTFQHILSSDFSWLVTFFSALFIGYLHHYLTGNQATKDQQKLMWRAVVSQEELGKVG